MKEAFSRFMPEVADIASRTMTYSQAAKYKAGIVEGDLTVDKAGLVYTNEMVPTFADAPLGALFITDATAALDLAQSELNRFLRPVNPHWQSNESAIIQNLRLRIPI
jgi:hypothetical protein